MLRRKPTALTLTTEDIAIYEDKRAKEAAEAAQQALGQHFEGSQLDLKGRPGADKTQGQVRTREERLGLARN
ncbi:hypothetical protein BP6252_07090 [Coleophoma cylindrospora]|uniref:Anaphase-promoting complex subunit CDC26 n=1 Tax=Coleophoma cylindrospora TaxID=1849047 RepID=A0A3D8RGJ1_9HELO|nr:hypothetical protein BP6252_07090 [Coleophoma cylindrospora]